MFACGNDQPKTNTETVINATPVEAYKLVSPSFNADSAYYFLQKQVDFGPRVTASSASIKCAKWISSQFKKYGATVIEQKGIVTNWDKKKYEIINIIAQINPKASTKYVTEE